MDLLRLSILTRFQLAFGVVCTPVSQPREKTEGDGFFEQRNSSYHPRDVFFSLFLFLLFFSIFPFLYGFALFNRVSLGFLFLLLLFSFFSFQRREGRSRIARMKGKTSEERTPDLSPDKSTYIYTHRYTVELLLVSKVESQEQEKNFILLFHPLFLFSISRFTEFQSFLSRNFYSSIEIDLFFFFFFSLAWKFTNFPRINTRGRHDALLS